MSIITIRSIEDHDVALAMLEGFWPPAPNANPKDLADLVDGIVAFNERHAVRQLRQGRARP